MSHDPLPDPTQRRRFIGQLVGGAAAVAAAACARAVPAQAVAPVAAPTSGPQQATADSAAHAGAAAHHTWDLSWTERLTGTSTHRQVFDAPEIAEGTVLHQARMFYVNYKDVYGTPEGDLRAVLVLRCSWCPSSSLLRCSTPKPLAGAFGAARQTAAPLRG